MKRLTQWAPRPDVEWDDAVLRWRTAHVDIVRGVPRVDRYVQNVCVPGPDGSAPPYAGLGELWFKHADDARTALASDEWRAVLDDAATFMDMGRVVAAWTDDDAVGPCR